MKTTAYIVNFRKEPDGPSCTNVAVAACGMDVEAEYAGCDWVVIHEDAHGEAETLKGRGCPVVECAHRMTFEEFDEKVGDRKTGVYGRGVDMYTRRGGGNERVFRVQWYERSAKYPTHDDYLAALRKQRIASANGSYCPAGNEWVEKNKTFPYTPEGLDAAIRWADEEAAPKWEAFANREN